MRFYEFAQQTMPVLKISQLQKAKQIGMQGNIPPTVWPQNTPQTPPPESIKVYPQKWKHEWIQKYLAAQFAKDEQTLQPSEEDIVKAYMRYADYQRKTDQDYDTATGSQDNKSSWSSGHRWVKREA